jgi:hypothetical protein
MHERMDASVDHETGGAPTEIPIDDLEYRGAAALQRALDLRTALEDGIVSGDPVGPILDEIFDLIRLGMK